MSVSQNSLYANSLVGRRGLRVYYSSYEPREDGSSPTWVVSDFIPIMLDPGVNEYLLGLVYMSSATCIHIHMRKH